jgi:hypothetical protein
VAFAVDLAGSAFREASGCSPTTCLIAVRRCASPKILAKEHLIKLAEVADKESVGSRFLLP